MRQQQTIPPGTIQLTAATYTLVAGYFQCAAVASPDVTEATTPTQVYQVLGEYGVRSRFEASHMRGLTPFVGRERELAVLHERLAQAATGQGQVVGIVGEPGIGKSRLLYEFCHGYRNEPVTYRDAHCLSYGNTTPYLPVRDLLRQVCAITDTDSPESITARLHQCLHEAGMAPATWLPYLQQLLGYRTGTEPLALLSPEAIKRQTFTVLRQMQLQASRQQPLILVVEDLQWVDTISEDFFASLVDSLAHAAVLFVATYRPGYQPPWMSKSYAMQLTLPPLAPRDSQSLVQSLCQGSPVSETLLQTLLTGAEGNPLFLEEMTRAALEHGETPTRLIIPATIQDMFMARLDRLSDGPRRLLQTASVLGRDVPRRLLEGLWEGPGDLDALLLVLSRQEFLDEHPGTADLVYRFRHALMQDVAYSSMVLVSRQGLHAAAGRTLEALHADQLDTVIERLAYHYAHSAEADKAITYLRRLATRAARSYAHIEALAVLAEARHHVARLPEGIRERHLLDLSVLQAFSLSILGRFREIFDLLLPQQELADRLGEPLLAGPYYFRLGMTYFYVGDTTAAIQNAQRAIAAAQQGHDATTMGQAYYLLAMERYATGQDLAQGIVYARYAVTVLDSPAAWHWRGLAHFMVGVTAVYLGDFPLALEATGQVQAIGDASGDPRLQSFAAVTAGWIATMRGEWATGITTCQRSLALAPDPFSAAVATGFLGYAYLESGDAAQAVPLLEQAVAQCEGMRYRLGQGRFASMLSVALLMQGRLDAAFTMAQQSLTLFRAINHRYGIGLAQRTLGRIAQARGALAEAEQTYTEALTIFAAMSARYELGRTYLDFASLTAAQGNQMATSAHLNAAHALFANMQLSHYVQRIASMLQS
jgi:tetratricopeptide (TPR) repeat protein